MLRPLLAILVCSSLACATSDDAPLFDEVVASDDGDLGKADGASELKVRAGDTSVWFRNALEVRGNTLVLRGRASRNVESGHAFVMDDIYGDVAQPSARTFEVSWPVSYARMLIDGVDLFVGLDFVHSASRPDALTAHVVARPRLGSFTGSSQIYLVAALQPTFVAGRIVYRLRGTTQSDMFSVDSPELGVAQSVDARHFTFDVAPELALAHIADRTPITVRVQLVSGFVEKHAVLGVALHQLGLTDGDAYEEWPHTCTDDTRTCLQSQSAGAVDLAACGDAFALQACRGSVGLVVGSDVTDARVATVQARIDEQLANDASALVGSDRTDEFVAHAGAAIVADVQSTGGRWFLDAQGRDATLDAVVEGSFDRAYAFPLAGFSARPAAPGDEAATRQVVADALLGYLAEQDYLHSEFERSYVQLAHEFRTQHLASLRAFRETVAREDYPGMPGTDIYVADWLGAYTEVSVDAATGVVSRVYVELD